MKKMLSSLLWWLLALLYMAPLAVVVVNSLKTFQELMLRPADWPQRLQWENYVQVYRTTNFPKVFFNTALIVAAAVAGTVVLASMCGYMLSRVQTKLSGGLFGLILLSMMLPFQTIMIPIVKVTQSLGLRDNVLSLIPIYMGMSGAMAVLLYHGFTKGVPRAIEESARMDGCCGLNMFFRIILPLFMPVTATVVVMYVLQFWNDITLPMVLLTHKENTTVALSQLIFYRELVASRWNLLLASGIMSSLPVIFFYLLMQKKIIAGVTQGAEKG